MKRDYDLVDLWFDHHERLPPELATVALEQLAKEPWRLEGRVPELIESVLSDWARRCPTYEEVWAVRDLLAPLSKPLKSNSSDRPTVENQPIVHLFTGYTKRTREKGHFTSGFHVVNTVLMPSVVRLFNTNP